MSFRDFRYDPRVTAGYISSEFHRPIPIVEHIISSHVVEGDDSLSPKSVGLIASINEVRTETLL